MHSPEAGPTAGSGGIRHDIAYLLASRCSQGTSGECSAESALHTTVQLQSSQALTNLEGFKTQF